MECENCGSNRLSRNGHIFSNRRVCDVCHIEYTIEEEELLVNFILERVFFVFVLTGWYFLPNLWLYFAIIVLFIVRDAMMPNRNRLVPISEQKWNPNWLDSTTSLSGAIEGYRFLGERIEEVWTLWDEEEWFNDAPVVLKIGKNFVELCANKIGSYSFSMNTIDLGSEVYWCSNENEGQAMRWRKNMHEESKGLKNGVISEVGITQYLLDPNIQNMFKRDWVVSGVYFKNTQSYFEVFNSLDCNGLLAVQEIADDYRYVPVHV